MKTDIEADFKKALQAHREGRLAEAERAYLDILKAAPDAGPVLNAVGSLYLDLSEPEKARAFFQRGAALTPPDLSACYNLGRLRQLENDAAGAIAIYRAIIAQQPRLGLVWNNLGLAYREMGAPDEAISCFRRAVAFAPETAEAWNNLGVAQDEFHLNENAVTSYRKAIELQPDYLSAHFNLGVSLQKLGRFQEAEGHYNQVLAIRPDDPAATFMLQSLGGAATPEAAPAQHVRRIFDQCAGTFEKTLVKALAYRTPELLFNLVQPHLAGDMAVLDLGCGTGLGSQFYRPHAQRLVGVDVSFKMLLKASEKKIYDGLVSFDILGTWPFSQPFDLIYSSDVFVYFGNLAPVIHAAASSLVAGGLIAFSVEKLADDTVGYKLFPSGRYAHTRTYIEKCLRDHHMTLLDATESVIREQAGDAVKGLLVVAKKGARPEYAVCC